MATLGYVVPEAQQSKESFHALRRTTEGLLYYTKIDKDNTDAFTYNEEYIQHLIEKLGSGEYDPELLNDAERAQIEQQLKSQDL